ncbi:MAG TPA: DUF1549 domain-containing protein [Saprospiraceae bacterium]|nr:DUF1549 domain-containing protein [Saprospiraceae bacterium]
MENITWVLQLLGRFHPLLIHFPIGILILAFFFECLTIGGRRKGLRESITWMVYLGALVAVFSALSGYLLRSYGDYTGQLVNYHQYLGLATTLLAGITAGLLYQIERTQRNNYLLYRISLGGTVLALLFAGHFGASLTHGSDFLTSVLPGNQSSYDKAEATALLRELKGSDTLTTRQRDQLNLEVRGIFAHHCYQCHNENKQKGGLVLDHKAGVFKGGESGVIIVPHTPGASELYRRVTLPVNHEEVMPKKGKVLHTDEIALIKLWIEDGAHWSDQDLKVFPEAPLALEKPALPRATNQEHPVDQLIEAYFEAQGMDWPGLVDDRTFVKRAYMDGIGLLPEPATVDAFINDTAPNKREKLIDSLLGDSHNYTQHWLSFWNDLLRNDYSGPGFITGGRKQITDWLYTSLEENKPYDQMVSELVNPTDASEGFIKGIKWRGEVNASQRTEMQAAQNIGQSLLGVNVKCASCHNSFVSNLTLEETYGFASVFADSVLELNRCDKPLGRMATVGFLYPELGAVDAQRIKDRLQQLSQVIVKPENGRLYRTISNRIWERLMGRGIVEPLDEMDNPPWSAPLLDWLAAEFIDSGHDLKYLIRLIMTSQAYQLPAVSYAKAEELKSDYQFEGPVLKRLSAEQFSDAVSQVIAPMYAAVAYDPSGEPVSARRIWHPEVKFDRGVLPEPGVRYFRKTFTLPEAPITTARVLISVDHAYTLYINGRELARGTDWRKVDRLKVADALQAGKNTIAIAGENEGSIANPAGILFSMKIVYASGDSIYLHSDASWKSTAEIPPTGWTTNDCEDEDWTKVRNYGTANWGKLIEFSFARSQGQFARASLVKQHPFMKALGRPTRENVTSSRNEQATLLQALELTNGTFFNEVLEEGARLWLDRYQGDSRQIVRQLYRQLLGRYPTAREMDIVLDLLGDDPGKAEVQDLFWSLLILPEFQFIY